MVKPKFKYFKSMAVLISAAALVVVGSIMAYFTSNDEITNKFVGSRFDIFLTETKWDAEKAKNVVPGDELDKNPQITNKERTDGYVFIRVTVPCDTQLVDNDDGTPMGSIGENSNVPMYKFMVLKQNTDPEEYEVDTTFSYTQKVNDHWSLVKVDKIEDQFVYVYAYAENNELTVLRNGDVTEPLFDRLQLWNFNESYDPTKAHNVRVEGLGIQTDIPGCTAGDIDKIWAILEQEAA